MRLFAISFAKGIIRITIRGYRHTGHLIFNGIAKNYKIIFQRILMALTTRKCFSEGGFRAL
jgi:hypothetical protein